MATGRTVPKYFKCQIDDSGGTMRDHAVLTINDVGLSFAEDTGITALQDAVMGSFSGQPDFFIDITGPFSDAAVASASGTGAAATPSGSHPALSNLPGGVTPLGFGLYFGMQAVWATGDPVFGLTSSSANGLLCMSYTVNANAATYSARFRMAPASAVPAWGTSAIS